MIINLKTLFLRLWILLITIVVIFNLILSTMNLQRDEVIVDTLITHNEALKTHNESIKKQTEILKQLNLKIELLAHGFLSLHEKKKEETYL